MTPENQLVKTRGAARPRNLAVGCLAVLVVLAACGLLARCVRQTDAEVPAEAPVTDTRPVPS